MDTLDNLDNAQTIKEIHKVWKKVRSDIHQQSPTPLKVEKSTHFAPVDESSQHEVLKILHKETQKKRTEEALTSVQSRGRKKTKNRVE